MRGAENRRIDPRRRRAARARRKQIELGAHRLVVHRSNSHMYAQVVGPDARIVASSSTLDKEVAKKIKSGGTMESASAVGRTLAARVLEKGVDKVAFDRGGYRFHGRVKALAEAARTGGLKF